MRFESTLLVIGLGVSIASGCGGEDGAAGPKGETGSRGDEGEPGEPGEQGEEGEQGAQGEMGEQGGDGDEGPRGPAGGELEGGLATSCLSPCHGFTGIVDQWKSSKHFATYIANLGGEEVDTWTGPRACGNCHAIDAIEQRVAGNVLYNGSDAPTNVDEGQINYLDDSGTTPRISESAYAGQATVAVVHCTTCHDVTALNDPHLTGEDYEVGSFPLRVPSGDDDEARIERSSDVGESDGSPGGAYGVGNACIWCHKSRKDVKNYIVGDSVSLNSIYWGPHEGPHSDVFTGVGGYHYPDKDYSNSSHQALENGCVDCHMPSSDDINQGVGDHSFYPKLSVCQECHATATSFDVGGGQRRMRVSIQQLREVLNTAGYLTRGESTPYPILSDEELADREFNLDHVRPGSVVTEAHAGAVYNYLILARGSAGGIHNPIYVQQLIYDSYEAIEDEAPPSIEERP